MKIYTALLLQMLIWSGYTLIEWLSKYDLLIYKVIMFFVFFYLAINIGNWVIKSAKKTIMVTIMSLSLYASFHLAMSCITHW
ncbi:hypothetical protein [Cytobacillus firmus]|uniref:Group-specific protein n=1 Tax=Cytobacillus firmus DS1 TaxID=1307436 RepID=W7L9D1_CYTFI|nr:hypothetical protein [Cytobacillus firmus]EWG11781.1 hypothetical protein PBF_06601 [Cytobacillus firmus DS1]